MLSMFPHNKFEANTRTQVSPLNKDMMANAKSSTLALTFEAAWAPHVNNLIAPEKILSLYWQSCATCYNYFASI